MSRLPPATNINSGSVSVSVPLSVPLSVSAQTSLSISTAMLKHNPADLVLANLRLLNLHLKEDWPPSVSSKTFSTSPREKEHNAKHRIKCSEWILYRLFELWDPEATRDKLQPFFPPLEPLQSLNLRGALFRCLNELKKNGLLGRESVLRKTMLDECKGDKFIELMVVFSTLVLRRATPTRVSAVQTRSERLATAPTLSGVQQASMIPLGIAYTASLGNTLRKRQEKEQRYKHFDDMLDGKRTHLRQRVKSSAQHKRSRAEPDEDAQMTKAVRENWRGSAKWSQALLGGDEADVGDLPYQRSFDEVWEAVSEGRSLAGDAASLGLLAGLERRVQVQQERIQMWQEFHQGFRDPEYEYTRTDQQSKPVAKLTFNRHQRLQLGSPRNAVVVDTDEPHAYVSILGVLRKEIADASTPRRRGGAGWTVKAEGMPEYHSHSHDLFSPVKGSAPESVPVPIRTQPFARALKPLSLLDDKPLLLAPAKKADMSNGFKIKRLGRTDSKTDTSLLPMSKPSPPPPAPIEPVRAATPEMPTPIKITQATPVHQRGLGFKEEETEAAEQTEAEAIISAAVAATPSPAKHMSLTERTRMSMAFFNKEPNSIDSALGMPPISPSDVSGSSEGEEAGTTLPCRRSRAKNMSRDLNAGDVQRRVSLLERTRMSMAAVPTQPRKSLHQKRSSKSRNSLFPVNQFETPGKPRQSWGEGSAERDGGGETTPKDKLFSGDAEYESVFKSRPRIALSPVPFTPESVDGEDGRSLLEGSDDDDERRGVGGGDMANSPLVGRSRIVAG